MQLRQGFLQDALQQAGSKDWQAACSGLLALRRLAVHDPQLLQPHLCEPVLSYSSSKLHCFKTWLTKLALSIIAHFHISLAQR